MDIQTARSAFAVLSLSGRLEVIQTLAKHEPHGLTVGQIATIVDRSQPHTSKYLTTLFTAGLVTRGPRSRTTIYHANSGKLSELKSLLGPQAEIVLFPDIVAKAAPGNIAPPNKPSAENDGRSSIAAEIREIERQDDKSRWLSDEELDELDEFQTANRMKAVALEATISKGVTEEKKRILEMEISVLMEDPRMKVYISDQLIERNSSRELDLLLADL
ncbi:helix-turn-helix transcriptional regulator [Acidisphaera sp. L21]|uniref:ArsR/SmtB family transcription factor n=1 Tax=Acidisphaera sp. L21 TaxID=1641851 RepID=UPI00131AC0CD|nr:ArsR family transcriptional regulator [Acidisphaera sp. L21]